MPLKKKNLLVCFLSNYVKTTAAGSYDMVILHRPNNLNPCTIEKCSCGHSCKEKGLGHGASRVPYGLCRLPIHTVHLLLLQFSCGRTALSKKLGIFSFYSIDLSFCMLLLGQDDLSFMHVSEFC